MKKFDLAIIGGGASGLMCANILSHSFSVAIIDKNSLGKKILVTGNGRCNFTNKNLTVENYNTNFVKQYISEFDYQKCIDYFDKIGIPSFCDEEGRAYPLSETAKDVQTALVNNSQWCEYISENVIEIKKERNFEITIEDGDKIIAEKVIMACGNSNLKDLLKKFPIEIENSRNVLCGFKVKDFDKKLFGIRENCIVKYKNFSEYGQVQFRKDGISGIVIFNLSSKILEDNFNIELEFLPNIAYKDFVGLLKKRRDCLKLKAKDILFGYLKTELANYILQKSGIKNLDRALNNITDTEIEQIAKNVKSLKFTCCERYEGEILAGGVKKLKGLETNIKDLYCIGECANVYGKCGGYNLHWAWASGYCLAQKLNKEKN